jgi:predicted transcriptional regulator
MSNRTYLERALIRACLTELDELSDETIAIRQIDQDEIDFAIRVLREWKELGAKEAFSRAAALLELGEKWRR